MKDMPGKTAGKCSVQFLVMLSSLTSTLSTIFTRFYCLSSCTYSFHGNEARIHRYATFSRHKMQWDYWFIIWCIVAGVIDNPNNSIRPGKFIWGMPGARLAWLCVKEFCTAPHLLYYPGNHLKHQSHEDLDLILRHQAECPWTKAFIYLPWV